ncbi:MAG: cytochrome P460 family protein [Burkholderiaceae bacterium]|nr:cytochrome P460 family protein [Sulfuritalea sp.]MCF8175322.1 cytochrome P460 family protein [Burkholderiaceae bacterium]MCF8183919.1 cytochrome P460 family protein [Polynucleobacter sp.]
MRTTLAIAASIMTLSAVFSSSSVGAAEPNSVPYPTGYRNWHHVKSMVINPGHGLYDAFGGIHHLYANTTAQQGYKTGKWSDGAVIVFDLLEARSADNVVTEGARKVVGVMHRNARKYKSTGGWGYEGFKGDSMSDRAVGSNALTACHQCHIAQEKEGFVFSKARP